MIELRGRASSVGVEGVRPVSESDLVERVKARDLPAFEELYRSYHPRLWRFLARTLSRPHLIDDVLNDTMMVIWERIGGFEGRSRLSTWIFAIAYRQALHALRRSDLPVDDEAVAGLESGDRTPEEVTGQRRSSQLLEGAIEMLSPVHRAVINLTYVDEFGYKEIADILGCPVNTVKTRMFHARRHLKQSLSGDIADYL